jgi:hypothetical protein
MKKIIIPFLILFNLMIFPTISFSKMSNIPIKKTLSTSYAAVDASSSLVASTVYRVSIFAQDGSDYVSFYIADDALGTNERLYHGPVDGITIKVDEDGTAFYAKSLSGTPELIIEPW